MMFRESKPSGVAFREFQPLNPTPIAPPSTLLQTVRIVHVVGALLLSLFVLDLTFRVTDDHADYPRMEAPIEPPLQTMRTAQMRMRVSAEQANAMWRPADASETLTR